MYAFTWSLCVNTLTSLTLITVFLSSSAAAQTSQPLTRLQHGIHFDGLPNEPAWQAVEAAAMSMFRPTAGGVPTEKSLLKLAFDDRFLYVGAEFTDSSLAGGEVKSLIRDAQEHGDRFILLIDTFDDNESAVLFGTNPAGVRWDASVANDGVDGALATDWNAHWDVKTDRGTHGWSVEMRIPLWILRFQSSESLVRMGVTAIRIIGRKNEIITFPQMASSTENAYLRPSFAANVTLSGLDSATPIYVTPYVLTGAQRQQSGGVNDSQRTREIGGDVRFGIGSNMHVDLTINTDFAQVESDAQQINLSRFSILFQEKRQFFLERSGVFDYDAGEFTRLFHSRRIGLSEHGEPVPIIAGLRAVARLDEWDVGALGMHTQGAGSDHNETFAVARARRRLWNQFSHAGGIITSRWADDGMSVSGGIDTRVRVSSKDYLLGSIAASDQPGRSGGDNTLGRIGWRRFSGLGLDISSAVTRIGADFQPAVGFMSRRDITAYSNRIGYTFAGAAGSTVRRFGPTFFANGQTRHSNDELESGFLGGMMRVDLQSGANAWVGFRYDYEAVETAFPLSGSVTIPVGVHESPVILLGGELARTRSVHVGGQIEVGQLYDGTQLSMTVSPTWVVSPNIQLQARYSLNRIAFDNRAEKLNVDLVSLRLNAAVSRVVSGAVFLQYNTLSREVSSNLRLRANFSEGRDLFVVFNRQQDANELTADAGIKRQAVLVKFTTTFAPAL